jgi:tetraacyldisaccharide 4'-kinase
MQRRLYRWLQDTWYGGGPGRWLLLPLSGVFWLLVAARRWLYKSGLKRQVRIGVPVIVVGNLTAGGTGKTPVTLWLAEALQARGFRPGLVSRGYGGSKSSSPMRVDGMSDPATVGDEPVLLARRSGLPVCVDRDRVRAAQMLVDDGVDIIIADDGLQHLRLARDYEICVVDGRRWLGNCLLLPAGPLRDVPARLREVDQILVNGRHAQQCESAAEQNAILFELVAMEVRRLNGSLTRPVADFAGTTVHAVAAIGNPERFFAMLRDADIQVLEHAWPDHAALALADLSFADDFVVLMTEKDAVKIGSHAGDRYWCVPVNLVMDPALASPWLAQIESRMKSLATGTGKLR